MFSPDEVTQTTDALEQLPRNFDRRSALTERRHNILQQKQTDALPAVALETPNAKLVRRVTQLREENKRLHAELDVQRAEVEQLISKYDQQKNEFEHEVSIIHSGHQQEVAQYQSHLQEMIDERDRLYQAQMGLEQRYQELSTTFQQAVEEEVQKRMEEIARGISLAPDQASTALQDVVKELERQAKEEGNKYLAETVYLKREAMRMISILEQERQQLATQRQEVFAQQYSVREQAELRQRTLHDRLHARWRVTSLLTTLGLVGLLVVLQLVCLSLLHVSVMAPIAFALIVPIVACVICAFVFTRPITMLHHMFKSAPHLKKVKKR